MKDVTIESGIKFKKNSELRKLKPVLETWIKNVQQYSKAFKNDDACWWYTERANVGILAAAAWKANWLALEEYSTLKRGQETVTKNGRCDLYITKKDHHGSFAFEAKHAWQTMRSNGVSKITDQLNGAWNDAGKLKKNEANTRVAACFVIPKTPASLADDNIDNEILPWLNLVLDEVPWDAVVWVFPKESRQLKNDTGTRIFPGVLLILQERQRANKISK